MILGGKDSYIDILMVYFDLEMMFIWIILNIQHCIFVEHVIATKLEKNYKVLKFQGLANASSSWSNTLGIGHTKYVDIYILY